jgi:hypothetical protein
MQQLRRTFILAAVVSTVLSLGGPMFARAGASAAVTPRPVLETGSATRVDGHYKIVSTDCYFSRGSCTARFDIEQHGVTLSAVGDRYFHGNVNGDHVKFGEIWPPGVSEDSWWCTGTTHDRGRTITGTMTDGIGGSGTFRLTYQRT